MKHLFIIALAIFITSCATENRDTISVIHSRKSVRSFTDQPVERETLMELVRAGMAAPSGMDRRPWEFVIVEDRAILDKMAEELPYAKMLKDSPAAIVVCGNSDQDNGGSSYWYLDCAAASQNILLAAESLGLGATWTAAYPRDDRMVFVKEMLGLPDNISALCVIPIGYPTGVEKPKDKYDADKIHINRW